MSTSETEVVAGIGSDYGEKYGFHDPESYVFKSKRGLSPETVEEISAHKSEPDWMRRYRLRSLEYFRARPMPGWHVGPERKYLAGPHPDGPLLTQAPSSALLALL